MATANVAEKPLGCRVDPADDPRFVEDVARDADALQSSLDVAADFRPVAITEVSLIRVRASSSSLARVVDAHALTSAAAGADGSASNVFRDAPPEPAPSGGNRLTARLTLIGADPHDDEDLVLERRSWF